MDAFVSESPLWNSTDMYTSLHYEEIYKRHVLDLICVSLFSLLVIPVVFGNLLVLAAIYKDHRLHTPTHVLIASLALADLVVGAVTLPTFTLVHHMNLGLDHNKNICLISYILSHCPTGISSVSLLVISIERFIAIHFPFEYQKWFTTRIMKKVSVVVWVYVWICLPVIMFTDNHWSKDNVDMCNFADVSSCVYRHVLLLHMIGVLLVTTILHSIVAYTAWQHKRRIAQQLSIIRADIKIQRDAKTARMLAMILGIFYLCWVPYLLTIPFTKDHQGEDPFWLHTWEQVGGIIVICNSFLNPLIYAWQNHTFRRAFQKILCLRKYHHGQTNFFARATKVKTGAKATSALTNEHVTQLEMVNGTNAVSTNDRYCGSCESLDDLSESYAQQFRNKLLVSESELNKIAVT